MLIRRIKLKTDKIVIAGNIVITIIASGRRYVRVAIDAPHNVTVEFLPPRTPIQSK